MSQTRSEAGSRASLGDILVVGSVAGVAGYVIYRRVRDGEMTPDEEGEPKWELSPERREMRRLEQEVERGDIRA